jgi:hypothetical protein
LRDAAQCSLLRTARARECGMKKAKRSAFGAWNLKLHHEIKTNRVPTTSKAFPINTQRLKLSYFRIKKKLRISTQKGIVRFRRLTRIADVYPRARYLSN